MTSLTAVYEGRVRWVASRRRLHFGLTLFFLGTAMVVAGIVVATTRVATGAGMGLFAARELAGTLAGIGVPAAVGGVFAVLPTSRGTRATTVIGASVAILGVALFRHAYPYQWLASGDASLALTSAGVYCFGAIVTFCSLFVAVATLKTRNAPGGTATVEVTEEGRIRIVEQSRSIPGVGGIGLFGSEPDGDVETQTNDEQAGGNAGARPSATVGDGGSATVDAGGSTPADADSPEPSTSDATPDADPSPTPDDDFLEAAATRGQPDAYCGNCKHFEYVRSDGQLVPYCGLEASLMEDMEACDRWDPNS